MRRILYKGTFARNQLCSRRRRIDEADISTPVAVDQRATNCLEEAVRSFGAGVDDRHALQSSTACFWSCSVLVGPLLPNSHHCGIVPLHTSSYCATGKSSFTKADNLPTFKLRKLLEFRRGGILRSQ
ncbi:hypothetical protein TNCV_1652681 [Trichonephila clavipes]|nr:hypothetical protein TNCV_1652681 [Trichonephila clavipes]